VQVLDERGHVGQPRREAKEPHALEQERVEGLLELGPRGEVAEDRALGDVRTLCEAGEGDRLGT
jgi:hypothetical protein